MYETRRKRGIRRPAAFFLALAVILSACLQLAAAREERTLIPMGTAVGIKLFADGALVVDVAEKDCRLKTGDLLLEINDEKIRSTEFLQSYLQRNAAAPATLALRRGSRLCSITVTPRADRDGVWRIGAWVRDSMAGIGTVTYYDPATGRYGALGHGINDVDTAALMSLSAGSIMETSVKAVKRSDPGDPGELRGDFAQQRDVGTLTANTAGGIFGTLADKDLLPQNARALPIAAPQEVKTGPASILTTVAGSAPQEYAVEITKVYHNGGLRNLLLRVTDPALLERTGGIVQGMSGSPILQEGRLVGAVTHVLIDDPAQGYGIFIDNMLRMGA